MTKTVYVVTGTDSGTGVVSTGRFVMKMSADAFKSYLEWLGCKNVTLTEELGHVEPALRGDA